MGSNPTLSAIRLVSQVAQLYFQDPLPQINYSLWINQVTRQAAHHVNAPKPPIIKPSDATGFFSTSRYLRRPSSNRADFRRPSAEA